MRSLRIGSWNLREGVVSEEKPTTAGAQVAEDLVHRLNANQIDIVGLQEVDFTARDDRSFILDVISARTELKYTAPFPFSPSSFFKGKRAGVAIASRFPIRDVFTVLLPNPNLEKGTKESPFRSYDKGIVGCSVDFGGTRSVFASLHAVPFRRFGVHGSEPEFANIWDCLSQSLNRQSSGSMVVCGDFNTPARHVVISRLNDGLASAVAGKPTHQHLSLDDILFTKDFALDDTTIEGNFSDHALCIAQLRSRQ